MKITVISVLTAVVILIFLISGCGPSSDSNNLHLDYEPISYGDLQKYRAGDEAAMLYTEGSISQLGEMEVSLNDKEAQTTPWQFFTVTEKNRNQCIILIGNKLQYSLDKLRNLINENVIVYGKFCSITDGSTGKRNIPVIKFKALKVINSGEIIKLTDLETIAHKLYIPLAESYAPIRDKTALCTLIGETLTDIGVTNVSHVTWQCTAKPEAAIYRADCTCTTELGIKLSISCMNLDAEAENSQGWEIIYIKNQLDNKFYYVYDDIAAMLHDVYDYKTDTLLP